MSATTPLADLALEAAHALEKLSEAIGCDDPARIAWTAEGLRAEAPHLSLL